MKRATQYWTLDGDLLFISIHALVKRATGLDGERSGLFKISIHALVKRATNTISSIAQYSFNFNPRPREEDDLVSAEKGANDVDFNPRPREEGDKAP